MHLIISLYVNYLSHLIYDISMVKIYQDPSQQYAKKANFPEGLLWKLKRQFNIRSRLKLKGKFNKRFVMESEKAVQHWVKSF